MLWAHRSETFKANTYSSVYLSSSEFMRGRLQCYMWMGWDGWMDEMVIIGRRSSKSTFGANKRSEDMAKYCILLFFFQPGEENRKSSLMTFQTTPCLSTTSLTTSSAPLTRCSVSNLHEYVGL